MKKNLIPSNLSQYLPLCIVLWVLVPLSLFSCYLEISATLGIEVFLFLFVCFDRAARGMRDLTSRTRDQT